MTGKVSTDRGTAHDFLNEGSATRAMIEAIPAQLGARLTAQLFPALEPDPFRPGRVCLNYELGRAWKDSDVLVPDVPETLARTEAMPYSFGYAFCTG